MNLAIYAAIGANVKRAREAIGMSQAGLAERVGFLRTSVINLEKGRQRVPLDTLAEIADILRVAPGDLLPPELWPSASDSAQRIRELEAKLADVKVMLREIVEEL